MQDDWLMKFGFDLKILIAGLAGGIVHTFFFKQTDPYTVIGSILSGLLTANFIAPWVAELIKVSPSTTGFILGFGAMSIMQGLVSMIKIKMGIADKDKTG